MTISFSAVVLFLAKLALAGLIAGMAALFILWPINDKPVSKTQKVVYAVTITISTCLVFGLIEVTL